MIKDCSGILQHKFGGGKVWSGTGSGKIGGIVNGTVGLGLK